MNAKHEDSFKICELGCRPALPSLAIAKLVSDLDFKGEDRQRRIEVIATDIDQLALKMCSKAAYEQNLQNILSTHLVDLTGNTDALKDNINADLYIISDVFESNNVAIGTVKMTVEALNNGANVWVFAQSDRAQHEVYRMELERLGVEEMIGNKIEWKLIDDYGDNEEDGIFNHRLLLYHLDEVSVDYEY